MSGRIYFDHSATTPLDPRVLDAMLPFLGGAFGNPSSPHREGREARQAIETARAQVAALIGADPSEIVFTASGTEADNLAILGTPQSGSHVVTSAIEHPAVLEPCRALERRGVRVTRLPVDSWGRVSPLTLSTAITPETYLVSIMAANNVVGTLQPIEELARVCKQHGVLFHTDAVQAAGKIALDVKRVPVDLLSLSAHKLHGPKGIGALYVRRGVKLSPVVFGGGQERGLRSATENVAGIVGFGAAAEIAAREIAAEAARLTSLRRQVLEELQETVPQAYLIGHPVERLPGHLCLGLSGHEGEVGQVISALDEAGIAVSGGSACSSGHESEPSKVLMAMGFDGERARGLLRITLGRFNSDEDIQHFLGVFPAAVSALEAELVSA